MTRAIICCAIFLVTACSAGDASENSSDKTSKLTETESTAPATASTNTAHKDMMPIQLNDGKPWKADEEMIQRVAEMRKELEENISAEQIDQAALAQSLDHHTGKFVESCTMKGQGHEELHKWLEPYMGLIKELHNAESNDEAKEIMDEMQAMLKAFGEYFE